MCEDETNVVVRDVRIQSAIFRNRRLCGLRQREGRDDIITNRHPRRFDHRSGVGVCLQPRDAGIDGILLARVGVLKRARGKESRPVSLEGIELVLRDFPGGEPFLGKPEVERLLERAGLERCGAVARKRGRLATLAAGEDCRRQGQPNELPKAVDYCGAEKSQSRITIEGYLPVTCRC